MSKKRIIIIVNVLKYHIYIFACITRYYSKFLNHIPKRYFKKKVDNFTSK